MCVYVYGVVLLFKEMCFIEITNTSKTEKGYIYSFKKYFINRNTILQTEMTVIKVRLWIVKLCTYFLKNSCRDVCKFINVNRLKDKLHDHLHSFMITALERLGIQMTYLNIIKEIHSKPTVDSNLNKENNNAFPLTSAC